jgi:hypothetical protein
MSIVAKFRLSTTMRRSIMKYKIILCLALFSILTFAAVAQAKDPRDFTEEFFKMVQVGKIPEAYDQLFQGSQIPAQKPQQVEMMKKQTASLLPLYGNILGVEKIREEKIGNSIVRLVYVLKLDIAPTVWEFYFYKPQADWILGNVIFNDQFNLLYRVE